MKLLRHVLIGCFVLALVGCSKTTTTIPKSESGATAQAAPALNIEDSLKTVVLVFGGENGNFEVRGSGMFTDAGGKILTNEHVVTNQQTGDVWPEITIFTTTDAHKAASCYSSAQVLATDQQLDLALLQIDSPLDTDCNPTDTFGELWYIDPKIDSAIPHIGEELTAIGYPAYGDFSDRTVTITQGHVSGFVQGNGTTPDLIKTDTLINHGNSGGAAFNKNGDFVGIPSQIRWDDSQIGGALGLLIPASVVNHWFDRLGDQGVVKTP